jgi:ABC-type nickel/cobalt efflux system permease component RcnA
MARWFCLGTLLVLIASGPVRAHPVPRRNHDRTVVVRLTAQAVIVDYRLDADEFTVVYDDLPAVISKAELARLSTPREFYDAFMKAYAPVLTANLVAKVDAGEPLPFQCVQRVQRMREDNGQPLDHLRFDFRFQAAWPTGLTGQHQLTFQEENFRYEEGVLNLSLAPDNPIQILSRTEPEKSLRERQSQDLKPGEEDKRRLLTAAFLLPAAPALDAAPVAPAPTESNSEEEAAAHSTLLTLLLDPHRGLWVLLCLAFGFGAAHALTPGHGKTLVAAYLVGERGTVWHALVLGLVTTLTHTGTVIALAAGLLVLYPDAVPAQLRTVLGVGGGLLVAGMGFWLLLRRLAGQADHIHLGGHGHYHHHHHHHHHGPGVADHVHDEHGHIHPIPAADKEGGFWGMLVLGISGGIIPCWDAIAMFGFAVSAQRLWLALYLLLAFSAGLAVVLIATGILVVRIKSLAASRWEDRRFFQMLPLVSAVLVTVLGFWLCYDSLHQSGVISQ